MVSAYHAELLATLDPTTPQALVQGRHIALVVLLAGVAAGAVRIALSA